MHLLLIGDPFPEARLLEKESFSHNIYASSYKEGLGHLLNNQKIQAVLTPLSPQLPLFLNTLKQNRIKTPVISYDRNEHSGFEAFESVTHFSFPKDTEDFLTLCQNFLTQREKPTDAPFKDPLMHRTLEIALKAAPSDANILITGESGTGKEVLARYIHKHSQRAQKQIVAINCAAIPDNLLESELFGHEKGAFTGATAKHIGKMESAQDSTLLLDEISEMPPRLQAKLLRALQEKEIYRVGGQKGITLNFRLIATSNRDLPQAIQEGNFRQDLYYRLNIINLHLPPLRMRPEDIHYLADHFLEKHALPLQKNHSFAPETRAFIQKYPWPGNARELENAIQRALVIGSNQTISIQDLGFENTQTFNTRITSSS